MGELEMSIRIEDFQKWLDGKRAEVAVEEPLSIQRNISLLSQALWQERERLAQVTKLHRPDHDGYCFHDHRPWPCPTWRVATGQED